MTATQVSPGPRGGTAPSPPLKVAGPTRVPTPAEITRRALGGHQLVAVPPTSSLLCTEDPDCRVLAAWKLLTARRGRHCHWTGRAACNTHTPPGSVPA